MTTLEVPTEVEIEFEGSVLYGKLWGKFGIRFDDEDCISREVFVTIVDFLDALTEEERRALIHRIKAEKAPSS